MEKILKDKNYMEISGDEMPIQKPDLMSKYFKFNLIIFAKMIFLCFIF